MKTWKKTHRQRKARPRKVKTWRLHHNHTAESFMLLVAPGLRSIYQDTAAEKPLEFPIF